MKHLLRLATLLCLPLVLALGGCGGGKGASLKGVVTMDGTPLDDAEVSLHPQEQKGSGDKAKTDANGKFEMLPERGKPPLLPGKYHVRISKWVDKKTGKPPASTEGMDPMMMKTSGVLKNVVPDRYSSATRLEDLHTVEIKPGANEATFDVKSK